MRFLILGGSHFVGRALVEAAVSAGHEVDVLNRGLTGRTPDGAQLIRADRTRHAELVAAINDRSWDAVIDTWAGAPIYATLAADLLGPRTSHYGYVSSRSVYSWPIEEGIDETRPVVDGYADDTGDDDYATAKRGSEVGILNAKPDALIARPGLILGPYEDTGRLTWWLQRLARGGKTIAPGPQSRPLQYIDARDLALWMVRCAESHSTGIFNAVSRPGHATMAEMMDAAIGATDSTAELVWLTPEQIAAADVAPWTELPIWTPPEGPLAGLHNCDVSAAVQAGLKTRSIIDTVDDTWSWLQAEGVPPERSDRPKNGLEPVREAAIIERYTGSTTTW